MITRPVLDYKFAFIYSDSSFISLLPKIIAITFLNILNYYYYLELLINVLIHLTSSEASIIYRNMLNIK